MADSEQRVLDKAPSFFQTGPHPRRRHPPFFLNRPPATHITDLEFSDFLSSKSMKTKNSKFPGLIWDDEAFRFRFMGVSK